MKKLSSSQLQQLGIAATAAFKVQAAHDLLDLPADVRSCTKSAQIEFWRQRECASITGICSFRELDQRHYIAVRDYFQKLAGITPVRSAGFSPSEGTANYWLTEMWKWAAKAGLHQSYVAIIARNKFGHIDYAALTLEQCKQLHDTLLNRARAKLGKGHTENRNKKQREERMQNDECRMPNGKPGRTYTLKPATKWGGKKPSAQSSVLSDEPDNNEPY